MLFQRTKRSTLENYSTIKKILKSLKILDTKSVGPLALNINPKSSSRYKYAINSLKAYNTQSIPLKRTDTTLTDLNCYSAHLASRHFKHDSVYSASRHFKRDSVQLGLPPHNRMLAHLNQQKRLSYKPYNISSSS